MKEFVGYKKGINLGGWYSQCDHSQERYDTFIVESDLERIKKMGFDHVRCPIDYNLVEEADGTYIEAGFKRIDTLVSWCEKYGLNLILDVHKTFGYSFDVGENETGFFDNETLQERFYRLWDELSKRYYKADGSIAFELLNEVTDKEFCDTWNRIIRRAIEIIRKNAPDTVILVGGYWNNSAEAVKDLEAPYDDRIVYNFHCYDPLDYTHQGASWVPRLNNDKRMKYEECGWNIEKFEEFFAEAIEYAKKNDTVLYCGEYGIIDLADQKDALGWFRDITKMFEKHNIGRALWTYKQMDFGLTDPYMDDVREDLLKILVG